MVMDGRAAADELELAELEVDLLLEGVWRRYGFDFRQYSRASIKRRLARRVALEGLASISGLQERLLHDPASMERLLLDLSINVTAMFRDPSFFLVLRRKVIPVLRTWPFIRIWHAGCSTGEEVYSLAIVLREEGLYDRCRIYATDINETVLQRAKRAQFPLDKMREYTENYLRAGGTGAFSQYYVAAYEAAQFDKTLRDNIVFAQHNLASDRRFNDFQLIVCRNVMIYFDQPLQDRVFELFHQSLEPFGILGLGQKESIRFSAHEDDYDEIDARERLYRRTR
jgi:chemotaxis protein methyltransferase CheR